MGRVRDDRTPRVAVTAGVADRYVNKYFLICEKHSTHSSVTERVQTRAQAGQLINLRSEQSTRVRKGSADFIGAARIAFVG